MRRLPFLAGVLLIGLALVGCGGNGKLRTRGQIVKNGQPYVAEEDDIVKVVFMPVPEPGEKAMDYHVAIFNNADGTFVASGKDGKGVQPGKYRIGVEHLHNKKDVLKGAFSGEKSPFVREVKNSSDTVTLDLAKPG
jgi:hypothetical protein